MSEVLRWPQAGRKLTWSDWSGSEDARQLAALAAEKSPMLVLVADAAAVSRLAEELPLFAPHLRVRVLPDWETLPYDMFSPHQDLVSERLSTLWHLHRGECDVVITAVNTAVTCLPPPAFVLGRTFILSTKQKVDLARLRQDLTQAGYQHVTQVVAPGEYSVRGGMMDLFPMGSVLPYRLEWFDDEIESLRTFDVDTQRSIYPVPNIHLLPAREFPVDDAGIACFRTQFRTEFEGDLSKAQLYKLVSQGSLPAGIEYYLPLFFEQSAFLLDFVPPEAGLVLHGEVQAAAARFWEDAEARFRMRAGDKAFPVLPPARLFMREDVLGQRLKAWPRVEFLPEPQAPRALPQWTVGRADSPLMTWVHWFKTRPKPVILTCESAGRAETLSGMLAELGQPCLTSVDWPSEAPAQPALVLAVAPLQRGWLEPADSAWHAVVTEADIYGPMPKRRQRASAQNQSVDNFLRDLAEVKVGEAVVHAEHGIGRYQGLVTLDLGDGPMEFLLLEYAGEDKLYVPVTDLHVISRYSGADTEAAPLHRLGTGHWEKAKRKALEQARDTAAELLHVYAQRAIRPGHAFKLDAHDYATFAAGFGYEETPDQAQAIQAVVDDMTSGKPMDRLVCGDVGFGKTEVALRAAFLAVMDGRQVAVLVPTTLLAEQHYQLFSDRFASWPVKLAELSRFRTGKEQKATLDGLAEGSIDIVIGTHKLVQSGLKYKNLGLVIIDEEHRFGVRQKEQFKAMRAEVDVLTLTATPIPRTLAMSLEGLRDFSVIATAPSRRLAVKTFVSPWREGLVREAVLRELKRGGQVFFLHNEVETILNMEERLAALLPEARIAVAHGQMPERDLELVMKQFVQQRFNVLLCTTIIETGIDVPNANTIVIHRADKFGLAQLHQLRGRVGRSHHQAYAYLMVPEAGHLTAQAKKRLEAIQMMEELGAGFYLAMHDLEIRGAGEVLGESQSGDIQEVGYAMYTDMLNRAVKALKEGRSLDALEPFSVNTEINLHTPALLPEAYCPDVHERLALYKRLANAESEEALRELQEELVDRFGALPEVTRTLLECHRLRLQAKALGIIKIDASPKVIALQFEPKPPIDPMAVILLMQQRRDVRLAGPEKLRVERVTESAAQRVQLIRELMQALR